MCFVYHCIREGQLLPWLLIPLRTQHLCKDHRIVGAIGVCSASGCICRQSLAASYLAYIPVMSRGMCACARGGNRSLVVAHELIVSGARGVYERNLISSGHAHQNAAVRSRIISMNQIVERVASIDTLNTLESTSFCSNSCQSIKDLGSSSAKLLPSLDVECGLCLILAFDGNSSCTEGTTVAPRDLSLSI
jgi:hypothetical protein